MHKSRLGGLIIDCRTDDLDAAADFWSQALGLPHPVVRVLTQHDHSHGVQGRKCQGSQRLGRVDGGACSQPILQEGRQTRTRGRSPEAIHHVPGIRGHHPGAGVGGPESGRAC